MRLNIITNFQKKCHSEDRQTQSTKPKKSVRTSKDSRIPRHPLKMITIRKSTPADVREAAPTSLNAQAAAEGGTGTITTEFAAEVHRRGASKRAMSIPTRSMLTAFPVIAERKTLESCFKSVEPLWKYR